MPRGAVEWPKKTHEARNRGWDSTRWNDFPFRDDDIVIDSWSKSGTTWMQQIVGQLIFKGDAVFATREISPWLDANYAPLPALIAHLQAQTHRRFVKTHLPVNALVFSPNAKYIYLGRDVRDVIWSLYNHQANITQQVLDRCNAPSGLGPPLERPRGDERQFYHEFLGSGGTAVAPYASFWEHVQGWWNIQGLPNVLLVHFSNLKADLPGEIRRVAAYLEIPLDEDLMPHIVEHCGFEYMQKAASGAQVLNYLLKEGAKTFFNKGTNGRWKDALSAEEIAKADEIAAQNLTPDCAHWLKTGKLPA